MFIQPVCAEEILLHIDMLDNKKSNDTYNIPVHIIKLSKHIIAPVLTTIFNNCIAEGIYPDALKVAKVIPIHKSGDTSNPSNYRPISILPHFSKIFEKILLTPWRLGGLGNFRKKNSSFRLPHQRTSSSADCARELFNGSNGSASLLDCTRKKFFWLGVADFL